MCHDEQDQDQDQHHHHHDQKSSSVTDCTAGTQGKLGGTQCLGFQPVASIFVSDNDNADNDDHDDIVDDDV